MNRAPNYASNTKPLESDNPRLIEAWALTEASRRLILAATGTQEQLRTALILNQRLWSIFQASLVDPQSPVPKEIRDNVLALSVILDRHIVKRLADLDAEKIQPIIDINRSVAEGLRQNEGKMEIQNAIAPSGANLSV